MKPLAEMPLDELRDLLSELMGKPGTPKRLAFVGRVEAEIAAREAHVNLAKIRTKMTRDDWLQLRDAAKAESHPLHAWFKGSDRYYAKAEHVRYPFNHRKRLQLGEIAPRSQADLDLIAGPDVDEGPPVKPTPAQRDALAKARSFLRSEPQATALATAVENLYRLAEQQGQLSPAQADFLQRSGALRR